MAGQRGEKKMDRRSFICSGAAAGASLMLAPMVVGRSGGNTGADEINVALLGTGTQGLRLLNTCLKIPGVRFRAVCDIWQAYNQRRASRLLKKFGHTNNAYIDYRQMLEREKGLDAVIIATPDFLHAEHTIACLKAGLHVYCEKEMSNTLADAQRMVEAARQTDKLLQIGHQRRSNPRYIYCYEKLIRGAGLLGQITAVNGQWNRGVQAPFGWPRGTEIDRGILQKYGYESMEQLRNWRWYKKLGGGPIVDLGSHQIDVYSWFLGTNPASVMASGRQNYYDKQTHEWYDTVMAVYEYKTDEGSVSAYYQTITTNSCQGYFETFMGIEGTLVVSEKASRCGVYREGRIEEKQWTKWVKKGYVKQIAGLQQEDKDDSVADVEPPSPDIAKYEIPVEMDKLIHQPHLENFFDAIRGKAKLNCPAEIGYETAVAVLKVNDAAAAGKRIAFDPEEFRI